MSSLLRFFIQRQAPPVCLVAHNGHQFDFPLLKSEMQRLGKDLPEGLLCADSLEAFKAIDEEVTHGCSSQGNIPVQKSHSNSATDLISGKGKDVMFTPIRTEPIASIPENGVNIGLPLPVFYNEQQVLNNITPELQVALESWKKEPPPAPCAKRCNSRINKIPPYEAGESDIKSVRKKLFVEKEKEVAEKATPPQVKGSETPLSVAAINRIECGQNHNVKKKLFVDGDGNPGTIEEDKSYISLKRRPIEEQGSSANDSEQFRIEEHISSGSQTPTQDLGEETQLYWGGDSIENSSVLLRIESWESSWGPKTESNDEMSDDLLLAAVLEAEEDETQKTLLDMEMMGEKHDDPVKRPADFEDYYQSVALPSTSGATKYVAKDSPNPHKKRKLSYNLGALHKRVVGYDIQNPHRAEDDCLALVRIFHRAFNKVCPWVDQHAMHFTDVSPMYTSKLKSKPCLSPSEFPYESI